MDALTLRRRAHRAHRWLGLIVGLQVFVWLAGGLVMTALPIERVRPRAQGRGRARARLRSHRADPLRGGG